MKVDVRGHIRRFEMTEHLRDLGPEAEGVVKAEYEACDFHHLRSRAPDCGGRTGVGMDQAEALPSLECIGHMPLRVFGSDAASGHLDDNRVRSMTLGEGLPDICCGVVHIVDQVLRQAEQEVLVSHPR